MAYTHGKQEYILFTTNAVPAHMLLTTSGKLARWAPGYMPFTVRAVSVQNTATSAMSGAATISFRDDALYGSATASGNQFTIITMTTGTNNLVKYRDDFTPREISQGAKVTAINTGLSSGETVICRIYGEWRWEVPVNATGRLVTG